MRNILAGFLILFFGVSSLTQAGPLSAALSQTIEVQISHTHDHEDDSYHSHDSHDDVQNQGSSQADETHTHTILITAPIALVLPPNVTFAFPAEEDSIVYFEQVGPLPDRSLGSIFRPPIHA